MHRPRGQSSESRLAASRTVQTLQFSRNSSKILASSRADRQNWTISAFWTWENHTQPIREKEQQFITHTRNFEGYDTRTCIEVLITGITDIEHAFISYHWNAFHIENEERAKGSPENERVTVDGEGCALVNLLLLFCFLYWAAGRCSYNGLWADLNHWAHFCNVTGSVIL